MIFFNNILRIFVLHLIIQWFGELYENRKFAARFSKNHGFVKPWVCKRQREYLALIQLSPLMFPIVFDSSDWMKIQQRSEKFVNFRRRFFFGKIKFFENYENHNFENLEFLFFFFSKNFFFSNVCVFFSSEKKNTYLEIRPKKSKKTQKKS